MGTLPLSTEQDSPPSSVYQAQTMAPFPEIKSTHSLTAKHVTAEKWAKLGDHVTKTSGFTLAKAIACAVEFDNQHCGIYAGDEDSYIDFADVFDPLICEYHGLPADFSHVSDMDSSKITGNVEADVPVHSCRIRVGRSIQGFGLSPGWTKDSIDGLKARCEGLGLQPRGTRGESGGQTGHTYDISNKHRLGYSEVQLVQTMIDGVNLLWKEDLELQKKHGM